MGYAAIGLAALGFAVGMMFRLQVLLIVVGLLLLVSILFSFSSGLSFLDSLLTIMVVQTIVQASYFLGLIARAALPSHGPRHIL
jgi:hypothetical protein